MSTEPWLLPLLQTADALFPTGAYAHSLGFEEVVRLGLVANEATLQEFLLEHLAPAQAHQELPYLRFAWEAAEQGHLAELGALEQEISAWKLPAEARAASRQIGSRRLRALRAVADAPLLQACEEQGIAHHLTVCGVQASVQCVPLQAALGVWYYQAMAGVCSAALKLMRIGQEGCQRALRAALGVAGEIIAQSLTVARAEAGWFSPLLEIGSMRHERAEERLFIS